MERKYIYEQVEIIIRHLEGDRLDPTFLAMHAEMIVEMAKVLQQSHELFPNSSAGTYPIACA